MSRDREYFKASRWTPGNFFFPAVLCVSSDGVTRYKPSFFGSDEISIAIGKIASVRIRRGPVFANILIESTGGTDALVSTGHPNSDARRIKRLIEDAQAKHGMPTEEGEHRPCPYCAEPIRPAAAICRFCGRDVGNAAA